MRPQDRPYSLDELVQVVIALDARVEDLAGKLTEQDRRIEEVYNGALALFQELQPKLDQAESLGILVNAKIDDLRRWLLEHRQKGGGT